MTSPERSLLEAISKHDWERATGLALVAWRRQRGPRLGELIERLDARADRPPAQWSKKADEFREQWSRLGAGARFTDIGPLLTTLDRFAFGSDPFEPREKFTNILERLALIARWPADPRVGSRLRRFLDEETRRARDGILSDSLLQPALRILAGLEDARTVPWLERFISHNPSRGSVLREIMVADAARRLKKHPRPLDPPWIDEAEAAIGKGDSSAAAAPVSEEALLGQIFADPSNLELRAILADVLLEKGDERGEFLSLELAALRAALTPEQEKRRAALQRKHLGRLLGSLAPVVREVSFVGGFAARVSLILESRAAPRVWKDALASDWLATISHVDPGHASTETMLSFITSPKLVSLSSLSLDARSLPQVAASPVANRIETLRLTGLGGHPKPAIGGHFKTGQ